MLEISLLFIVLSDRKFELTLMMFKQLDWKCTHSGYHVLDNLFGWFHLKSHSMFQDLSRRSIETSFGGIWDTVQIHLIRTQVIQTKLKWICLTLFFSRKGQILNLFYATRNVRYTEERKANHKNFSSEPHYPHFLIRATSIFSSFPLIEILIWRLITRPWEFVYKYF